MGLVVVAVCLPILAGLVAGQDRLPPEEAQRYAKVCVE